MEDNNKDGVLETPNTDIDKDEPQKSAREIELESTVANLVEEMKELRKKKELEVPTKIETPKEDDEVTKIANVVEQVLNRKNESVAKTNKQVAMESFISANKEFHPENDPTGLKRQALEEKINRFNTSGLFEAKDFYAVIEEASILLGKNDKSQKTFKEEQNPYSSQSFATTQPKSIPSNELTQKEQRLVDLGKTTKEKLLKIKASQPGFYDSLMASIRD